MLPAKSAGSKVRGAKPLRPQRDKIKALGSIHDPRASQPIFSEPVRRIGLGHPLRRDPERIFSAYRKEKMPARSVTFSFDPTTPISVTGSFDLTGGNRATHGPTYTC